MQSAEAARHAIPEAAPKPAAQTAKIAHTDSQKAAQPAAKAPEKKDGVDLNMGEKSAKGDKQDGEFEKY